MIIPNHTVAFRSNKRRPLGIAYGEFGSEEDAQKAVKGVSGTKFRGRVVSAKVHVPFVAKPKPMAKPEARLEAEVSGAGTGTATSPEGSGTGTPVPVAVSSNTIYIPKVHGKTSDKDVRAFFQPYNPQQIYVFTEKKPTFFGNHKSALVTVECEKGLDEIIEELKGKRMKRYRVVLKPAFVSKIERVVAADKKRLELPEAVQPAETEPVEAVEAATEPVESVAEPAAEPVAESEPVTETEPVTEVAEPVEVTEAGAVPEETEPETEPAPEPAEEGTAEAATAS